LYLTGDKSLQYRLSLAVEEWHFERRQPAPYTSMANKNAWPALVNSFSQVRHISYTHLHAKSDHHSLACYPLVQPSIFPVGLRSLKLECNLSSSMAADFRRLVNLDDLSLGPKGVFKCSPMLSFSDLPPNLTFLHCTLPMSLPDAIAQAEEVTQTMREMVPCFDYLRRVSLPNCVNLRAQFIRLLHPELEELHLQRNTQFQGEIIMELPQNLKIVSLCFEENAVGDFLPHLPSELHTLALHGTKTVGLSNAVLAQLPKSITSLRCPKSSLKLELFAGHWPLPNLLHLDIRGENSGINLCDLPRTLESLRLNGSFGQDLLALPPCLTRLVLPDVLATNDFITLIKGFEKQQIELFSKPAPNVGDNDENTTKQEENSADKKDGQEIGKDSKSVPMVLTRPIRHLKTLKLPRATALTVSCLWALPPSLTSLTLAGSFGEGFLHKLPRNLTKLILPNHAINGFGFKDLPRNLRRLELPAQHAFHVSHTPSLPPTLQWFSFGHTVGNQLRTYKQAYAMQLRAEESNRWRHIEMVSSISSSSKPSETQ
jgi:hypothetical protein